MPNKTARIRLGEPGDEDAVVEAMRAMHATGESGFRHGDGTLFAFSETKVRSAVRAALARFDSWLGVAETDGRIVGCVMLSLVPAFYSDEPYLAEQTLFVLQNYRSTNAAVGLLTFSRDLSQSLNVPLAIAVMSHDRVEAKTRLYARALRQSPNGGVFLISPDGRHHE